MRINSLYFPAINFQKNAPVTMPGKLPRDEFIKEKKEIRRPISGKEDFDSYKNTIAPLRDKKYASISLSTKWTADASVEMAQILKDGLDREYKERTLVSIGRSPAGILRALEYMGEDVIYLPISGLGEFAGKNSDEIKKTLLEDYDQTEYKKFLDESGISAENINKGKRKYIFYDYTYSGTTLKIAETIANEVLGIDKKNAKFKSLNEDLLKFSSGDLRKKSRAKDYIDRYLSAQNIEYYTNVPHLDYNETHLVNRRINAKETERAADFDFALCHRLNSMGLLV